MFSFENLDVYKVALQFSKTTIEETRLVPKGYFSLIDQLRRASTSIVLNIAEGSGRYAKGEKKQFYSIAKGSAYECVPLLTLFGELNLIQAERIRDLKETLQRISQMLTKLVQVLG